MTPREYTNKEESRINLDMNRDFEKIFEDGLEENVII